MRTNWVRERLLAGKPTAGCFMGLGSPLVAELLAHAGYDWLSIEMEHNGLDMAGVQQILMAMNATDCIPIARIPSSDPVYIQPRPRHRRDGHSRSYGAQRGRGGGQSWPPRAIRQQASAVLGRWRASNYTLDYEEYFARANDNMLVVLMLETKGSV